MDEGLDDPRLLGEWFAVAWSRDVATGRLVARRLLGRDVVLWRSAQAIHCWRDLCVHRGAQLSLGKLCGERLVCPYHAWEYNSAASACIFLLTQDQPPPLKARAQTYQARERYGMVWVCIGEPLGDVPQFAFGDDPAFRLIPAGPYLFRAKGPRVIENFLDVAHLGFVHAGMLGDAQHAEIEDYEVGMGPHGPKGAKQRFASGSPIPTARARAPWSPITIGRAHRSRLAWRKCMAASASPS